MKSIFTKFAAAICLLSGISAQAQCTLSASVTAVPTTTPGLNYNITGSYTGTPGGSTWDFISILETGTYTQGTNTLNYTFPGSGNYTVCYYISDSSFMGSCYDSTCIIVPVNGNGLTNCSTTFSTYANGNNNYSFQASSLIPPGWVSNYYWDYGDGTWGAGNPNNYTYPSNGTYTVTLTTTSYDPNDTTQYCTSTYTTSINATGGSANCTLTASIWSSPDSSGSLSYSILGTYSGGTNTADYTMVDGNVYYNVDTVNYTFTTAGSYYVCYYVEDSTVLGYCYDSTCVLLTVGPPAPFVCSAYFTLWPDSFNTSTYWGYNQSNGSSSTTYLWDFGDGTTATGQYPSHTYAATGFYNVCLTMYDSLNNCTDTYCDSAGVFKMMGPGISQINIIDPTVTSVKETNTGVSVNVFPNPITENSSISIKADKNMKLQMNVVNVMGQTIATEQVIVNAGKNNIQLKANELQSGIYFLNIYDGNKLIKNIKLVK